MNNKRRHDLQSAQKALEQALDIVETALSDEEDCLDNLPYNRCYSDKAYRMEEVVSRLSDASLEIQNAIDDIADAVI